LTEPSVPIRYPKFITVGSVVGILAGFGLGILASLYPSAVFDGIGAVASPVGQAWTRSLLLVVVPLVVCYLVLAASGEGVRDVAAVGGVSLAVFLGMMLSAAAFTLSLGPWLLARTPGEPGTIARAVSEMGDMGIQPVSPEGAAPGLGESLVAMIPDSVFGAAARGDLIGLILVSVLFGLALSRIGDRREVVLEFVRGIRDAVLVATHWVLLAIPFAAFALAFDVGSKAGVEIAGILGYYMLVHIGLLITLTLLLYPAAAVLLKGGVTRFARSVWIAQGVAASTRSSLASVPALVEGAEKHLELPDDVVALTLPLGASTFKMNTLVSTVLKVIFLAHIYGLTLEPTFIAMFIGVQIVTSPSVPGIPSGGYVMTLPLYVAAGIPVEGVIFLKALDGIPDIFKTVLNSTSYQFSGVVVARVRGWRPFEKSPTT
jgi:Na+/H+-dicarboxylate symporter